MDHLGVCTRLRLCTLKRWCMWVLLLIIGASALPAVSQPAFDLSHQQGTFPTVNHETQTFSLLALEGLNAQSSPNEALEHEGYRNFRPKEIYDLNTSKALWLRFRLTADSPLQIHWTLRTPKTYLDRLELHYRDAQGQWRMQQAGDNIAHAQWTHRNLSPQFVLPLLPAGEHVMLIKIVQAFPQQIPLDLQDQNTASQTNQSEFLKAGMIVGLLALILLLTLHFAFNYRDPAYAWYALYVLLSLLTVATYLGLAAYLFWPQAIYWPEQSILTLVLLSIVCQLLSCQNMFLREMNSKRLRLLTRISVLLSILCLPRGGSTALNSFIPKDS